MGEALHPHLPRSRTASIGNRVPVKPGVRRCLFCAGVGPTYTVLVNRSEQIDERAVEPAGLTGNDLSMLCVVLIWGANFSVVKLALREFPPLAFTGLRFALATALLLLVLRWREGREPLPSGVWWRLVGLGLIGNTLYQTLFIYGLQRTTAANSALLVATSPVLVPTLGALFGIERLRRPVIAGIALAFAGMALVIAARGVALARATLTGDLLMLASAVCWSLYTLGVRSLGGRVSTLRLTALTTLTGTPGLLLLGAPQLMQLDWGAISLTAWLTLAYAVLLALVVAYALWNLSVRKVGGSRTAVYSCAIPLVATLIAWPLLGERPRAVHAAAAVLIIGGVLLTRRRSANEATAASMTTDAEAHATG